MIAAQTTEELMALSVYAAQQAMCSAVDSIDGLFGKGYAAKNPSLVGCFMAATMHHYVTGCTEHTTRRTTSELSAELEGIVAALRSIDNSLCP